MMPEIKWKPIFMESGFRILCCFINSTGMKYSEIGFASISSGGEITAWGLQWRREQQAQGLNVFYFHFMFF